MIQRNYKTVSRMLTDDCNGQSIEIELHSLLFVLNLEESGNLVECFVFSFGNFFVGEDPEDCQEHTKGKEGVVLQHCLKKKGFSKNFFVVEQIYHFVWV